MYVAVSGVYVAVSGVYVAVSGVYVAVTGVYVSGVYVTVAGVRTAVLLSQVVHPQPPRLAPLFTDPLSTPVFLSLPCK